jgi:predicted kinase
VQAVIFCGLQGSGKTTLYRDRFLATHVRISMDLLRTRAREAAFLEVCLGTRQPFVVDNTNATARERARYIAPARAAGFRVIGYLVEVDFAVAAARNAARAGRERVPEAALRDALRRFVRPDRDEGFDELWHAGGHERGWTVEPLLSTDRLPGL